MQPNARHVWRTDGMDADYDAFLPLGTKEGKAAHTIEPETVFKLFSNGVKTSRDDWMFDFHRSNLAAKVKRFVASYNSEVRRWAQRESTDLSIDAFVENDDTQIKWSETLKAFLKRGVSGRFDEQRLRHTLYRPFCKQYIYFDRTLNERVYQMPVIFPTPKSEGENMVICVSGLGHDTFQYLIANQITEYKTSNAANGGTQCFPLYTYNEDGSGKRENITDWALGQFRARYGDATTKRDIFHFVYALLHHPTYRAKYAENLRRELPRVPFVAADAFPAFVAAGEQLAALHLGYESAPAFPLVRTEKPGATITEVFGVHKMKYADRETKTAVIVNPALTLSGVPPEAHQYRLGNRSALDWVLDQYQIKTDARSGITSDPNRPDDPQYIVRLIGQVVHVSVETVRLVAGLPPLAVA